MTQGQRNAVAAYIIDRAEQYDEGCGEKAALLELVRPIREGEIEEAVAHGELDDIIARFQVRRTWKGDTNG